MTIIAITVSVVEFVVKGPLPLPIVSKNVTNEMKKVFLFFFSLDEHGQNYV